MGQSVSADQKTQEGRHWIARDQVALRDLLEELKLTDVTDIWLATETLYQELIDAEATAFLGAARVNAAAAAPQLASQPTASRTCSWTLLTARLESASGSSPGPSSSRSALPPTAVGPVFQGAAVLRRLPGSVVIEQHDEWEAGERRYLLRCLHARAGHDEQTILTPAVDAADHEDVQVDSLVVVCCSWRSLQIKMIPESAAMLRPFLLV